MAAVKIGTSRQVVIPKKIHDDLGLTPGDYLDVEVQRGKLVMTPKTLVNKEVERRLAAGLEDVRRGRVYGPFSSGKALVRSLRSNAGTRKRTAS